MKPSTLAHAGMNAFDLYNLSPPSIVSLVLWPSPLSACEKGSGNIVYNELLQWNAVIVYLQFGNLN